MPIPARLVLDTKIVLDRLHFGNHHTQSLQMAIDKGQILCFTAAECLAELERVSAYPEFGLNLAGFLFAVPRLWRPAHAAGFTTAAANGDSYRRAAATALR